MGDLNRDGQQDILYALPDGSIQVSLSNSTGLFPPATTVATLPDAQFVIALAEGDFNGDGKLDVGALYYPRYSPESALAVFLGNGDGTFGELTFNPVHLQIFSSYSALASSDFNGDGKADLVFLNGYNLFVLTSNDDGTFKVTFATPAPYGGTPAVGDLNGDGLPDIAFGGQAYGASTFTVLLNTGDGAFSRTEYSVGEDLRWPSSRT